MTHCPILLHFAGRARPSFIRRHTCRSRAAISTLKTENYRTFLSKSLVQEGALDSRADDSIAKNADSKANVADSSPVAANAKAPPSHLGPSVMRLIRQFGIDPSQIRGTGPHGIISKGDVLLAMENGLKGAPKPELSTPKALVQETPATISPPQKASAPAAAAPGPSVGGLAPPGQGLFEDIPNSQIRKIIAKRLLESKSSTPHYYTEAEANIDATLALRKELKEKHSTSISVNDFVIKATAMALKEVPEANSYWDEKLEEIVESKGVDLSVAVATDKGLMTPIVKNADQKSLFAISAEVKSLAEKARTGKLKPEEFQGGTFSISNLGMFSIDRFSAIINPPQSGILAIGRGGRVARWIEGPDGTGHPGAVTKMEVTLSGDHRVMDQEVAAKLLAAITANLEDPQRLLL